MNNTLTISKDHIRRLLPILVVAITVAIIGLIVAREDVLFLGVLVGLALLRNEDA
ncbi:hypothetical protein M1N77_00235 [Thermodesulfovibrionales bacterium]|nr:hypothetical protein [Thermodesulfovibrionales bacterium]